MKEIYVVGSMTTEDFNRWIYEYPEVRIEWGCGEVRYYKDGKGHCTTGPALRIKAPKNLREAENISKKLHLCYYRDGYYEYYYLNGKKLSKEDWFDGLNEEEQIQIIFNLDRWL